MESLLLLLASLFGGVQADTTSGTIKVGSGT
jgi:hypothetical protein